MSKLRRRFAGKSEGRWQNQLRARGWTHEQIEEAVQKGQNYPILNNLHPSHGATRYVHPKTGRSIVIDNATGAVIHVGGDGFKY
jgi:hypothetical protein